jgi:hypothetical protein
VPLVDETQLTEKPVGFNASLAVVRRACIFVSLRSDRKKLDLREGSYRFFLAQEALDAKSH